MSDALMGQSLPCSPATPVLFRRAEYSGWPAHPEPGTWYWFQKTDSSPYIVCPRCGTPGRLSNHLIQADGAVSPSIVCVMQSCGDGVKRCDAHYYGRLEGYAQERP